MSEAGLAEESEVEVAARRFTPHKQSGETFDASFDTSFDAPADKQPGEGFDAPPTLERSGSERRGGAVTSPLPEEDTEKDAYFWKNE